MKDITAGLIFVAVGAGYGMTALRRLPVGDTLNMGPGYFPVVLSGLLCLIGATVALRGLVEKKGESSAAIPWRAAVLLTAATLVFATSIQELGMLPGVFLVSAIAGLASTPVRPARLILSSLGIAAFCALVFSGLIRLPIPLFGTWFGA